MGMENRMRALEKWVLDQCAWSPWLFIIYNDICMGEMKTRVKDSGVRLTVRGGLMALVTGLFPGDKVLLAEMTGC